MQALPNVGVSRLLHHLHLGLLPQSLAQVPVLKRWQPADTGARRGGRHISSLSSRVSIWWQSVFTLCSSASKAEGSHMHLPLPHPHPQDRTSGATHLCTSATAETVQYHLGSSRAHQAPIFTQQTGTLRWLLTSQMSRHSSLCVPFLNVYTQAGCRTKRGVGSGLQAPDSNAKLRARVGLWDEPRPASEGPGMAGYRPETPEKDKDNDSSHHRRPVPGDRICTWAPLPSRLPPPPTQSDICLPGYGSNFLSPSCSESSSFPTWL